MTEQEFLRKLKEQVERSVDLDVIEEQWDTWYEKKPDRLPNAGDRKQVAISVVLPLELLVWLAKWRG